ncbi:MAG: hypothetical protein GY849_09250 [Deltaproteobacteria bacterium]|nr:hypothetical protein [Deltaproteobacteria bacterium]
MFFNRAAERIFGHDTDIIAIRKNGERFPANISFSVSEVEGRLYFTGIVKDISETRKAAPFPSKARKEKGLPSQ